MKSYLALSFIDLVAILDVEPHDCLPHLTVRYAHGHALLRDDGALPRDDGALPRDDGALVLHDGDGLPLPRENDFHLNETALRDGANLLFQMIDGDENGLHEVIRQ